MKRIITLAIAYLLISWFIACANTTTNSVELTPVATATTTLQPSATTLQNEPSSPPRTDIASLQMIIGRAAHTATLLPDGTVLITGGFASNEKALSNAEIFDPQTHTFSSTNTMSSARQSHTATLLPNGKVLLAGGFNGDYLASAELYDPATGMFTLTGSMTMARSGHVAVLLNNGKVLLAGGTGEGWRFLATAEIYDPITGVFSATGEMSVPRESHTATRLASGEVLITGGHQGRRSTITIYDSAELYDPSSGTFRVTGRMTMRRHKHDATLLADGRIFISGGSDERDAQGMYDSTEIFNPTTGIFSPAATMHSARYKHKGTSLLLPDGQVLLVGGTATTELYDPQNGTFREVAGGVDMVRLFATATLLPSGNILFAGGYGSRTVVAADAWVLKY